MGINTISIKFKRLHPDAKIPLIGSTFAAGFDIYSIEENTILPGETKAIRTGLSFEVPCGKAMFIWDRSGMGFKGIHRFSGLLDSDYRGELKVVLHNSTKEPYMIRIHDRIAQGVIQDYYRPKFIETDSLRDTKRDQGGFGSTGR